MLRCKNKHGIESFDKLTNDDYREAIIDGMKKQAERIREIAENNEAPTFKNTIAALDRSGDELTPWRDS